MNFEANATALLERHYHLKNQLPIEQCAPNDFTFKGSGSFRACYAKDGWVYKVLRYDRDNSWNIKEYEEYLRLVDMVLPDHVALPATELIHVPDPCSTGELAIIVMEEVLGEFYDYNRGQVDLDYRSLLRGMQKAMDLHDIMGTNVIINDDGWWPIDLHI